MWVFVIAAQKIGHFTPILLETKSMSILQVEKFLEILRAGCVFCMTGFQSRFIHDQYLFIIMIIIFFSTNFIHINFGINWILK